VLISLIAMTLSYHPFLASSIPCQCEERTNKWEFSDFPCRIIPCIESLNYPLKSHWIVLHIERKKIWKKWRKEKENKQVFYTLAYNVGNKMWVSLNNRVMGHAEAGRYTNWTCHKSPNQICSTPPLRPPLCRWTLVKHWLRMSSRLTSVFYLSYTRYWIHPFNPDIITGQARANWGSAGPVGLYC